MGGEHTDEKNIHSVIDLHKAGHRNKEISDLKGLNIRTVQSLVQRFKAGGCVELPLPR